MNKNNDSNFELEIQEDTAKLIKEHIKKNRINRRTTCGVHTEQFFTKSAACN
ncbi:hypothetical protein M1N04_01165 [Peptococcaceae bacterium]|nr:hypothetical protein [Peptococcaceae bacterium]